MTQIAVFLQVILLISACSPATNKTEVAALSTNDPNMMTVAKDSVFTIDLAAAAGRGYSWRLTDSAFEKNIQYEGETFTNGPSEKDGTDGMQHFKFKALEKGTATIHFIYVQPFVKPFPKDAPTKSFPITIQ